MEVPLNTSNSSNWTVDGMAQKWLQDLKLHIYQIAIPIMGTCFIISVITNALVLLSAKWLKKNMISPNLRLCISLAAADSWTAALMLGGLILNSLLSMMYAEQYRMHLDKFMCLSLTFELIRISAMLTSDWHLFALALNHCYSIMRPLHYKVVMTTNRCRLMIVTLWLTPIIIVVTCASCIPGQGYLSKNCAPDFYYEMRPFRLSVFLLFTVPLICTFVIYIFVLHRLWAVKSRKGGLMLRRNSVNQNANLRKKRKAVGTTLLIVGSFGVSWFPLVLQFFLICKKGCYITPPVDISLLALTIVGVTVNNLVVIKLLLNPLIYALRIVEIRMAVSVMCCSCFGFRSEVDPPSRWRAQSYYLGYSFDEKSSRHKSSTVSLMHQRNKLGLTLPDVNSNATRCMPASAPCRRSTLQFRFSLNNNRHSTSSTSPYPTQSRTLLTKANSLDQQIVQSPQFQCPVEKPTKWGKLNKIIEKNKSCNTVNYNPAEESTGPISSNLGIEEAQ